MTVPESGAFCLTCGSRKSRSATCYSCGAPVLDEGTAKRIDEARKLLKDGNMREAQRVIQQVIRDRPDSFVPRLRLAELYWAQTSGGDTTKRSSALREFENALAVIPDDEAAYMAALELAENMGRHESVREKLRKSPGAVSFAARVTGLLGEQVREGDYTQEQRFKFHGNGKAYFWIKLTNFVLTILTLGLYWFWGKVETRRYLLSVIEFDGDPLAYHGRGGEVLRGWIKAMVLLIVVPYLIVQMIGILAILVIPVYLGFFFSLAMVGMMKYRMSRTSWRNIRFSFHGDWLSYAKLVMKGGFLTAITFGFYTPYFLNDHRRYVIEHTRFGNRSLTFDGAGSELFVSFLAGYVLAPVSFGLTWVWFQVNKYVHFWNHTGAGDESGRQVARFASSVQLHAYLILKCENALLLILTLGLAYPWVKMRTMRFLLENLSFVGSINWNQIERGSGEAAAFGEGTSGFFGLDIDLG